MENSNKSRILFIINPISGTGKRELVTKAIENHLDRNIFDWEIVYTERAKHATELSMQAQNRYQIVAAVGGDGTVNEVSKGLIGSDTAMAIIPVGSGNGLARSLGISTTVEKAVKQLNTAKYKSIDTIRMNDECFVNVAGIGFDALISHKFANYGKRGFFSYLKIILREFRKFKGKKYKLVIDGKEIINRRFLVTFANSTQFGNNAYISPKSEIDDGVIEVCILKKFPIIAIPALAFRLFNKTIYKSDYIKIIHAKEISVFHKKKIKAHIDGDPVLFDNQINISVNKLSLKVFISD